MTEPTYSPDTAPSRQLAAIVRQLVAAGCDPAVAAVAAAEAYCAGAAAAPQKTARQLRNARYYQARKERLNKTSESVLKASETSYKPSPSPSPSSSPLTLPLITTPPTPPTPKQRATRLPDEWTPTEADLEFARKRGLSNEVIAAEALKFRNHWTSKGGKDATKHRWDRTWQNWILNVRSNTSPNGKGPTNGLQNNSASAAARRLAEAAERGEFRIAPRPSAFPPGCGDNPRLLPKG